MKLLAFGVIAVLSTSTVQATTLDYLSKVECSNPAGSSIKVIRETGRITGKLNGKTFNNNSMLIVDIMRSFPDDASVAFGGLVSGYLGFGNGSVVFSKKQSSNLNVLEKAKIFFIDMDGKSVAEKADCKLTFY